MMRRLLVVLLMVPFAAVIAFVAVTGRCLTSPRTCRAEVVRVWALARRLFHGC